MCEELRRQAIEHLFQMSSFRKSWDAQWQKDISCLLSGSKNNGQGLIDLGDHLSNVFLTTKGEGRNGGGSSGQASLSAGGAGWEGLVTWYLNLGLAGSRAVAIKSSKKLVPAPFYESIRVTYGTHGTNTESDILVLVFPEQEQVDLPDIDDANTLATHLATHEFSKCSLGVVQCKTNWNDNAQIPMLWDMLYSADTFRNNKISVGTTSYNIKSLNNFTYSFVTVPTSRGAFKANSTPVLRVNNLSGGNYWGKPSKQSVAFSLKEIFNNNFGESCKSFLENANKTMDNLDSQYAYFKLNVD